VREKCVIQVNSRYVAAAGGVSGTDDDDDDDVCLHADKLSRLCTDVQSRHSESLQLNVNSPLYKKFAK